MIDKRVIVIIVIFIIGGLFIYSFANPLEGEDHSGNEIKDPGEIVNRDDGDEKDKDKIDTTELDNIKEQLALLNKDDYTEESWNLLQDMIRDAESKTSQDELDEIMSQINFDLLEKKEVETLDNTNPGNQMNGNTQVQRPSQPQTIDKSGLNSLKTIVGKLNKNDYTVDSYKKVTDALNLPENTQAQVNVKINAIQNAINNLKPKNNQTIDKTNLNNLKAQASKLNKDNYTADSYKKVTDALNLPENTQAQVELKVNALQTAINNLKFSQYTVTFDADNNTNPQKVTVKTYRQVNQPANPVKSGYRFLGWYLGNNQFDFNTSIVDNIELVAKWQKRSLVATCGVSSRETAKLQIITNGNQITYKGTMKEKNPITHGWSTFYNYVYVTVTSPDGLSEEEYNNIKMVYDGDTYTTASGTFHRDSVTGITTFEILQPFNPNYGMSSSNLTTVDFSIYWGYGETKNYSMTFDIVVNKIGT